MSVTISLEDNVEDVIKDIETEVKNEIRRLHGVVQGVLDVVRGDARRYIRQDAELSGQLRSALRIKRYEREGENARHVVGVRGSMAPYAAIVELGTGNKTLETTEKAPSQDVPNREMDDKPTGFPFDSSDINPDKRNPTFTAFAGHIEDWMKEKGIQPEKPSYRASAFAIAYEIITEGTYAHPFLRPAWFEHELELRQAARQIVRDAAS